MLWQSVGDNLQLLLQFPLTGELVSCACVCACVVNDVWLQHEYRTEFNLCIASFVGHQS